MAKWHRARNIHWLKFSDADPTIVHASYFSDARGAMGMVASPCAQMTLVGVFYGVHIDNPVDCVACLGADDFDGQEV